MSVARRHLTRKEIKQPDHFVSYTVQTIDWVKAHTRQLLYGGLGVLIVVGLVFGWSTWRKQRLQQAEVVLYEAVKLLHTEAPATADDKGTESANRERAMQQLRRLTRDYSGTRVASLAQWHLGHLYFERRDYAAALAAYEQARQGMGHDNQRLIPALVTLNLGYAREATGDCSRAVASFAEVLQSPARWLRGEAFLGMGRCYESEGATDKALELYERALADAAVSGAVRQTLAQRQSHLQVEAEQMTAGKEAEKTPAAK